MLDHSLAPDTTDVSRVAAGPTWRRLLGPFAAPVRRSPWFPPNWVPSLLAARVLWRDYAHFRTVVSRSAVDREGNPLPWYTYPAIEFLSQLDFRDRSVFEFGSGNSTLFWAAVARRVVSVEDDENWYHSVRSRVPDNAELVLETDLAEFPGVLPRCSEKFDVVVVDGPARGRTRLKCARAALRAINSGGVIILDNSDWLPESSRVLRDGGLLQVDMTGFAPICAHVQTTSLFFDRAFNIPPRTERQPLPGRGSRLTNWEPSVVTSTGPIVECGDELFRGAGDEQQLRFSTGEGRRTFRAFTYLNGADRRAIAVLDDDRGRVLLSNHLQGRPERHRLELHRLSTMSWDEFRAMIAAHDQRRYVL
jgi:Methyltransferase domain